MVGDASGVTIILSVYCGFLTIRFRYEVVSRDEHGGDGEDSMSDSDDSDMDEPQAKKVEQKPVNLEQLDEEARNKAIITVSIFKIIFRLV